jgi:hypothetical protein
MTETRRLAVAWTALLAGPLAWFALLQTNYALVHWACATGHAAVIRWLPVGALAIAAAALVASWRASRTSRTEDATPAGATRILASLGMALAVLFLLVIVATLLPTFVLTPCT